MKININKRNTNIFNPIGLVTFFSVLKPIDEKTILLKNTNINHSNLNSKLSVMRGSFSFAVNNNSYKTYWSKISNYSIWNFVIMRGISTTNRFHKYTTATILTLSNRTNCWLTSGAPAILSSMNKRFGFHYKNNILNRTMFIFLQKTRARGAQLIWVRKVSPAFIKQVLQMKKLNAKLNNDLIRFQKFSILTKSKNSSLDLCLPLSETLMQYENLFLSLTSLPVNNANLSAIMPLIYPYIAIRINGLSYSSTVNSLVALGKTEPITILHIGDEYIIVINRILRHDFDLQGPISIIKQDLLNDFLSINSLQAVLEICLELNIYSIDLFFSQRHFETFLQTASRSSGFFCVRNSQVFSSLKMRRGLVSLDINSLSQLCQHLIPVYRYLRLLNGNSYTIKTFLSDSNIGGFLSASNKQGSFGDVVLFTNNKIVIVEVKSFNELSVGPDSEILNLCRLEKSFGGLPLKLHSLVNQLLRSEDVFNLFCNESKTYEPMCLIETTLSPSMSAYVFQDDFQKMLPQIISEFNNLDTVKKSGYELTHFYLKSNLNNDYEQGKIFVVKGFKWMLNPDGSYNFSQPYAEFKFKVCFVNARIPQNSSLNFIDFVQSNSFKTLSKLFNLFNE